MAFSHFLSPTHKDKNVNSIIKIKPTCLQLECIFKDSLECIFKASSIQIAAVEARITEDGIKGTIPRTAITRKLVFTLNWKTSQIR